MLEKEKFMETLRSVAMVAQTSDKPLTKEEIIQYFGEYKLSEEQLTMVFQYLKDTMKGNMDSDLDTDTDSSISNPLEWKKDESDSKEDSNRSKEEAESESKFLRMYRKDLKGVSNKNKSEMEAYYLRLLEGDQSVVTTITDYWLKKVVTLAKKYSSFPVLMEDLIQEGNIGLLFGINQLQGMNKHMDVSLYLKESIQKAMENYINETLAEDDWEKAMLAKTTLIHEARKTLAVENAQIPTIEELANYTKLPMQEIDDILRLSKEND